MSNLERYVNLQIAEMDDWERSQKEHYQLLNACRERDTKAAVRLLKRHIDSTAKQLIHQLL
uniref:FCD domain-containing protein n=1 Tax=Hassallia byssoidea TaxID=482630 RepID=UPI0030140594